MKQSSQLFGHFFVLFFPLFNRKTIPKFLCEELWEPYQWIAVESFMKILNDLNLLQKRDLK
ncbi:hypothetical protein ACNF5F_26975, partial [Escherichia coli]|uniref:hypothetical protein n=1 Tax=Escherichia coli TaxID=562 RepID=UPI003BA1C41A